MQLWEKNKLKKEVEGLVLMISECAAFGDSDLDNCHKGEARNQEEWKSRDITKPATVSAALLEIHYDIRIDPNGLERGEV